MNPAPFFRSRPVDTVVELNPPVEPMFSTGQPMIFQQSLVPKTVVMRRAIPTPSGISAMPTYTGAISLGRMNFRPNSSTGLMDLSTVRREDPLGLLEEYQRATLNL